MKWLLLTSLYPTSLQPDNGLFNEARMLALQKLGHEVVVIQPLDLLPHFRYLIRNPQWRTLSDQLARFTHPIHETRRGIRVMHPRWLSFPRFLFWQYEADLLHFFCGSHLRRLILAEKPDAILCSWLSPFGVYASFLRSYFSGKIFVTVEGDDILIYPQRYRGWEKQRRRLNHGATAVLCASQATYETAVGPLGLDHVTLLPNGFDTGLFRYYERKPNQSESYNILCVGYLAPIKGQDLLIQALSLLDERFTVSLVGDGVDRESLTKRAQTLKVAHRVRFHGFVPPDKLAEFYHQADFYCQPSRSEGFGIAVLEALATGLPVIGFAVGGIRDKIEPGVNGYLAKAEDSTDLAEQLRRAVVCNFDRKRIAQDVHARYGWNQWAQSMTKLAVETR